MKKLNKIILLSSLALILAIGAVYGFMVLAVVTMVPPGVNCEEYEFVPTVGPLGLNYGIGGFIRGTFNYTGVPYIFNASLGYSHPISQTFYDTCVANSTLIEFVCGSSISPSYSQYAGAVLVQCGEPGVPGTQCVSTPYNTGMGIQQVGRCQ